MQSAKHSNKFWLFFGLLTLACLFLLTGQASGEPTVTDPEMYTVDSRRTPGRIIEIRRDGHDVPHPLTYAQEDSDPAVAAIAFYRHSEVFFVSPNSRKIMTTDGLTTRLVYEHGTYIRDIAFDSGGNLFFSESSDTAGDGFIFLLGYLGSDRDAGAPWRRIDLDEIGGYWSGNFAFDPSNKLFVSTGNRGPAAIYEYAASSYVRRYTFDEPITGFAFQQAHRLLFTNHGKSVYALENFSVLSRVFMDDSAGWLTDVAVITGYTGTRCSISGRLHGGSDIWNQTRVNAWGPNVFWRFPASTGARVATDGRYTLIGLPPGDYWLIADVRGDIGREFRPRPLAVVCPGGGRKENQDFRFE